MVWVIDNCKWCFFILLVEALLSPAVCAEDNRMTVEIYPLGMADFEIAEKIANGIVSPDGKAVGDKANNRIILYDYPEKHEVLRKALGKMQGPTQNVRIKVAFKENVAGQSDALGVDGRVRAGSVTITTPGAPVRGSGARIQAEHTTTSVSSLTQQELLVVSGGKARLRVGSDVPYADWFWSYGLQYGLWTGSVRWKEVGAQMVVEPYIIGDKIRVRLTPEFSYLLDQQTLSTAIEKLTTEVIVANGQEIDLGGLPAADKDFYSKFLIGYDHQREKRALHITLKPTIEGVQSFDATTGGFDNDRNVGAFRKR